jgi:hypothetical protein
MSKCHLCAAREDLFEIQQVYAGRQVKTTMCRACEAPTSGDTRPKRYRYNDWQLSGTADTLAVNIWNIEMSTRRGNGHDDARNAHDTIRECIVPEVENFVRQQCAKIARDWKAPMPPDFESPGIAAAADQLDAKLRPIQEAAAKKVAEAILERTKP